MIRWNDKSFDAIEYQLEEVTLKKHKMEKKITRCNDIFTFDIEVSSAFIQPNGVIAAYKPGLPNDYWNDLEKLALPYIWQFSINERVFYGREFKDFKKVLAALPEVEIKIFVHNLSYEFMFLQNIITFDEVFARAPHKPMKAKCKEFPHITFCCTYILTNLSLAAWGEQVGLPKMVGDLDYNKLRTPLTPLTDIEMGYCERDCEVVYAGIKDHLKRYDTVWDIPLTSTGKVREPVKKLVTADYEYMQKMHKLVPADAQEYKMLKDHIFAGGYTHASRKYMDRTIEGQIHHVDIASSYPFSLCAYKYPYDKWCYIGRKLPDPDTFEYRAYIIKLHLTGVYSISWNSYIQASKCTGRGFVYDNGRIIAADELYITVTEQDYITICNNYKWDKIESEGTYCCHKQYLPKIFIDFILDLYRDKTELKGVDPERYAIAKQYINSMFGMCVTAIIQADVEFKQDDPEQWKIGTLTEDAVNAKLDKLRRWFDKHYFLSYSVGCWCTAYSRRRLWSCFEMVQGENIMDNDLLYADTDSLFYLNDYNFDWFNEDASRRLKDMCDAREIDLAKTIPVDNKGHFHPLGVMEREPDCIGFKTLGSKKYLERREDGKFYMTVAGVNKGAVTCLKGFGDFRDGFEFNKDHPDMHKLEHTYITDMKPVIYPDGYYSDFKYGINMRPTGYTLSKPNIIRDFFEFMDGKIATSENYDIKRRGVF